MPTILAIESSCDDTSASVLHEGMIHSNVIANQEIHTQFGGVVPELASRAHQAHIIPVVNAALSKANIQLSDIEAIAVTQGPGLLGSLLVGTSFAKGLSMSLGVPLIGVNHMRAHILAHFIEEPRPSFPFLCLTVSGGHTQLVWVKSYKDMEIIGETQDDAVGEAFDKTAKILGLPYPGGPLIDFYAKEGNPHAFPFPEVKAEGFTFSFSGLKTSILYFLQREVKKNPNFIAENLNDICASVQYTFVRELLQRLDRALKVYPTQDIAIAGGVSANSHLREAFTSLAAKRGCNAFIPRFEFCTDNAAMIAKAAEFAFFENDFSDISLKPNPKWAINEVN